MDNEGGINYKEMSKAEENIKKMKGGKLRIYIF